MKGLSVYVHQFAGICETFAPRAGVLIGQGRRLSRSAGQDTGLRGIKHVAAYAGTCQVLYSSQSSSTER